MRLSSKRILKGLLRGSGDDRPASPVTVTSCDRARRGGSDPEQEPLGDTTLGGDRVEGSPLTNGSCTIEAQAGLAQRVELGERAVGSLGEAPVERRPAGSRTFSEPEAFEGVLEEREPALGLGPERSRDGEGVPARVDREFPGLRRARAFEGRGLCPEFAAGQPGIERDRARKDGGLPAKQEGRGGSLLACGEAGKDDANEQKRESERSRWTPAQDRRPHLSA